MATAVNGHAHDPHAEQASGHERVGFAFTGEQWERVAAVALDLLRDTHRVALEHRLRHVNPAHLRRAEVAAEVVEEVGSIAAHSAYATARHFVAQYHLNAEAIALAAAEAQARAAREAEAVRRASLGLPPEEPKGDDRDDDDEAKPAEAAGKGREEPVADGQAPAVVQP